MTTQPLAVTKTQAAEMLGMSVDSFERHVMADLKLEHYLGIKDKVAVAEQVLAREEVLWGACAAVGDDLVDVPLLKRVAWPFAVADAAPQVRAIAKTTTVHEGGRGAVREVVETILRHNGSWEEILKKYEAS